MFKKVLTAAGFFFVSLWTGSNFVHAQEQQENVEQYGPFYFLPSQPNLLIYSGEFGANDALNLKKALREHPTVNVLVLKDNPGGLVHIGLVVAQEVYERDLSTYIPADSYCASACSFVFFAGKNRIANGKLGVHQISAPELSGEQAQFGVSDIVATLPKYGVSAEVLGIMFSTPSQDMHFFTPHEVAKYGINREGGVAVARVDPARGNSGSAESGQGEIANPYASSEPATPAPVMSDEQKAVNAAALMIQAGSASNEDAMKFTHEFYADRVTYFKKNRSKDEILEDKRNYFSRWPVRRFTVDESSLHAKCDDSVCAVAGIFDYHVSSPERGKEAIGTSNFTYVLDFRDGIRIVMEDSEVVNR